MCSGDEFLGANISLTLSLSRVLHSQIQHPKTLKLELGDWGLGGILFSPKPVFCLHLSIIYHFWCGNFFPLVLHHFDHWFYTCTFHDGFNASTKKTVITSFPFYDFLIAENLPKATQTSRPIMSSTCASRIFFSFFFSWGNIFLLHTWLHKQTFFDVCLLFSVCVHNNLARCLHTRSLTGWDSSVILTDGHGRDLEFAYIQISQQRTNSHHPLVQHMDTLQRHPSFGSFATEICDCLTLENEMSLISAGNEKNNILITNVICLLRRGRFCFWWRWCRLYACEKYTPTMCRMSGHSN